MDWDPQPNAPRAQMGPICVVAKVPLLKLGGQGGGGLTTMFGMGRMTPYPGALTQWEPGSWPASDAPTGMDTHLKRMLLFPGPLGSTGVLYSPWPG
jgi:hypothetical protein